MSRATIIKTVTGDDIAACLPEVAKLRIAVFREYPYLYDGDLASEEQYLHTYQQAADSLFVLALDGDRVVGVSTALPMEAADASFRQPFEAQCIDPAGVFYLGESVLLPAYRGQGVGHRFFDEREAHARRLGNFKLSAFCAVVRPDEHPLRPADYRPLDEFWRKRGYTCRPELTTAFKWQQIDQEDEVTNRMIFWTRQLEPRDQT